MRQNPRDELHMSLEYIILQVFRPLDFKGAQAARYTRISLSEIQKSKIHKFEKRIFGSSYRLRYGHQIKKSIYQISRDKKITFLKF